MSEVITAGETVKLGSIGFWLVGSRAMPAALQIASHKPDALAVGCAKGKTTNPKIVAPMKIAATTATLRTTQGSFSESGVSWLIAEPQCRQRGPRRLAGWQVPELGSRSW